MVATIWDTFDKFFDDKLNDLEAQQTGILDMLDHACTSTLTAENRFTTEDATTASKLVVDAFGESSNEA